MNDHMSVCMSVVAHSYVYARRRPGHLGSRVTRLLGVGLICDYRLGLAPRSRGPRWHRQMRPDTPWMEAVSRERDAVSKAPRALLLSLSSVAYV